MSIDYTDIKTLPNELSRLQNLYYLRLKHSHTLGDLPECIFDLKNLEELDLQDTPLRKIPKTIRRLKKLKKLNLKGCYIRNYSKVQRAEIREWLPNTEISFG